MAVVAARADCVSEVNVECRYYYYGFGTYDALHID